MYPELLHIGNFIIYTYAFCIVVATLIASIYTKRRVKKELNSFELSNNFFYLFFLGGFVGGKLFFYLETPNLYLQNPILLVEHFSTGGFVFYGSLLGTLPVLFWYLKTHKIPVLPMLDILTISTLIAHIIGRIGCFFAGCCYGKPTNSFLGIVFPTTNNVAVHPSQLYEITALLLITILLLYLKKRQQFKGQQFTQYLFFYAISRSFLELFRGDKRGFIIDEYLSHSQFIALLLSISTLIFYYKLKRKSIINLN